MIGLILLPWMNLRGVLMTEIIITKALSKKLRKFFSSTELRKIISLMRSLLTSPKKGKLLASVGGVVIKELKYKKFRLYFITDGHVIKFGTNDELNFLIIKFIDISDKKDQQKIIDKLKLLLESLSFDDFE